MPKVKVHNKKGLTQETGAGFEVQTQLYHSTVSVSAAGPSSPDVSAANVVLVDTSGNNVTLGGLTGGVAGQVVHIVKTAAANNLVLENSEGDAQNFLLAGDTTMTAVPGMFTCVFDGTNWAVLVSGDLS